MLRFSLILAISAAAIAGTLEDASKALAQKVLGRLAADEMANVTWREGVPAEVQAVFARALQRRSAKLKPVEVRATMSENVRGPLLIAEIVREGGTVVEMVSAAREQAAPSNFSLKLTLLWEQEPQILDVAFVADEMLVLDGNGLNRYQRRDGQWQRVEIIAFAIPAVRDRRGHIDSTKDPLTFYLPGRMCSKTGTQVACQDGGPIAAGRNTMVEEGWPAYYTHVEIAGDHLLAETDGRVHVYASNRTSMGSFDGWGSDFAVIEASCSGPTILATAAQSDAVFLYGIMNHQPVRLSEATEAPGTVTAIWRHGSGAVVVAKNAKTGRYEAYGASVDCRN